MISPVETAYFKRFSEVPFEAFAGVVLYRTGSERYHAGLMFRDENNNARVLHLAWHYLLQIEDFESPTLAYEYRIAFPVCIHKTQLRLISGLCRLVISSPDAAKVPYGLKHGLSFKSDGSIDYQEEVAGFTCATFVLGIFKSASVTLVDVSTWPEPNQDDLRFQNWVIETLKENSGNGAQNHIEAVEKEVGSIRIRPTHVFAACLVASLPSTFDKIHPVLQTLRQKCPSFFE